MLDQLQRFLSNQHTRFMERTRAFSAAVKNLAESSLHYVNGLGKIALERYGNSDSESEHRYGTHVWLYIAIKTIAEKSAMPPLVLKRDDEIVESPLPPRPNTTMTWTDVNELLSIWMELCGNAYLYHDIENDEFYPLRPSRVKVVGDDDGRNILGYAYFKGGKPATNRVDIYRTPSAYTGELYHDTPRKVAKALQQAGAPQKNWMYDNPELAEMSNAEFKAARVKFEQWLTKGITPNTDIKDTRKWIPFEPDEILHFKYVSPTSGYYGLSPLTPLLIPLTTDLYARQWNKKFFENGAIPPGLLVVPGQVNAKDFKEIKAEFHKEFGGVGNRGKNMIIKGGPDGATYTPFPGQHRDMEFANQLSFNRDEILAVFGVPHEIVNADRDASHTSARSPGIRDKRRIFWRDNIQPKHKKKEAVWNQHYKEELEAVGQGYSFGHDYTDVEDLGKDWDALSKAAMNGLRGGMTLEEVRTQIYGLPAEPEGTLWIPSNVMQVNTDDETQSANGGNNDERN